MLAAGILSRYPSKTNFRGLLSDAHCEHACFAGGKNLSYGGREMNSNFSLCNYFNYIQIEKTY